MAVAGAHRLQKRPGFKHIVRFNTAQCSPLKVKIADVKGSLQTMIQPNKSGVFQGS